jgi:RNA polymerase sigma factor (sigma-70 family)
MIAISRLSARARLQGVMTKPFEEIVAEHGPTVLRVCRAVLGPDEAEDAWSETFLAALRAYPDLRPGSNVEAWLVTIAHRKAIDQHRARARNPVAVAAPAERPSREGVPGSRDTELWEALRSLPSKQRQAVAYHYVAGLPYVEIGGLLETSEAAARRAAADGIRALRARYRQGGPS